MHLKILNDRVVSLNYLISDMEQIMNETEQPARLIEFTSYVKGELEKYRDDLQAYLNDVEKFSFNDYKKAFGERENEIQKLIQEYITFKSKVASDK